MTENEAGRLPAGLRARPGAGLAWTFLVSLLALPLAATAAETPAGAPNDHFVCYKTRNTKTQLCAAGAANEGTICTSDADCGGGVDTCVANKFAKTTVTLEDAFDTGGPVAHTAIKPAHLCVPGDKNGEGIVDGATHLLSYRIKVESGEPPHVPRTGLEVVNQFGTLLLDTVKASTLLVPASKDPLGPIAAPDGASHDVDHFKCYKAKVTKGTPKLAKGLQASVADQFEDALYDLKKPTRLCRPVDENGEGIKNSQGSLLCYKAKPAAKHGRLTAIYTNDQFGPQIFDTIKQDDLCVPSVVLEDVPVGCDVLNAVECLLPYPSSAYLVDDASTATGKRFNIPDSGLPDLVGPPLTAAPYNQRDGFSPTAQILMHFPQGVDPELSDASRLLEAGCCGQPAGPPWIDTRTYTGRSLDADSPTLLLDADTGEQIIHWIERDARAEGMPTRQSLVMRPAVSLVPGKRYIVAVRDLIASDGSPVRAEYPFAALRDGMPTTLASLEARRQYFEDEIFAPLASFGVARNDLVLAFDFTVRSDSQLTHQILTMRDEAYAWLATVDANPLDVPFTVTSVTQNDCNVPGTALWRRVKGTFQSPLFLDADLSDTAPQFMNVDVDDNPVQNGFTNANFTISIPCQVLDPLSDTTRPVLLGHGLFQTGANFEPLITGLAPSYVDWNYIAGATDWRGLSGLDLVWVGSQVIGIGSNKLNNFEALPDRLSQGMLNTLVLGRMMKLGIFNRDAAFQTPSLAGVFPGPSEDLYYYGISLGGIMGTWLAALTPDVLRFGLDVPGMNFGCLLQRSTQFSAFESLLPTIGLTDPMETILGLGLLHEIWVSAEPAGFVRHVTTDRLLGSGTDPVHLLVTPAWLDKQVSNQCTEIELRTLGIPNLAGASLVSNLQGVADVAGPLDSAYVMWDVGSFDLFNPAHQPFIPPLANSIPSSKCDPHAARPTIPAAIEMLYNFMQPTGQIDNTCNGLCDAGDPTETPLGGTPCDPLN